MAGVAGRSGGGNITMKGAETLRRNNAPLPEEAAKASPDWLVAKNFKHYTRKEIYDRLAATLHKMGTTTKEDGMILSMIAQQYEILQHATAVYDKDPFALIGRALASRLITDAQKEIRILLAEFHLTPLTRNKRPREDKQAVDPLDAFLSLQ